MLNTYAAASSALLGVLGLGFAIAEKNATTVRFGLSFARLSLDFRDPSAALWLAGGHPGSPGKTLNAKLSFRGNEYLAARAVMLLGAPEICASLAPQATHLLAAAGGSPAEASSSAVLAPNIGF